MAPGKHPLIVFSHGYTGSGDQTIFLMEALARAGYIVAAPNHADAPAERGKQPAAMPNFFDPNSWDSTKFFDRKEDVTALVDELIARGRDPQSFLFEHVDEALIGAAGHSLGGYTVLGLAGARPLWRERRVRAVVAYSPYAMPYDSSALAAVAVPTMLQGGTHDWGITPFLPAAYAKLPPPKYYLVLMNENHIAWTNLLAIGKSTIEVGQSGNGKWMVDYTIAFFDQHLRGQDRSALLKQQNPLLDTYRFQAE